MYILILFFIFLYSVFTYADCFSLRLTNPYGYIREPYFRNSYSAEVCEWILDIGYYNVLEIRVENIDLASGDLLYIRDGVNFNSEILVKFYRSSNYRKFTTSTGSAMILFSRSQKVSTIKKSQFNITYQIKGRCIPNRQASCSETELSCYDLRYERCDSIWHCPISGNDERNCNICQTSHLTTNNNNRFPCSTSSDSKCYERHQRCDGVQNCDTFADELYCDPLLCGEHNKSFLCSTFPTQCISNALRCDGLVHCRDGSDESNCASKSSSYYESGRFRVIIVSSLSTILFLVMVALGLLCICRLRKIRVLSSRGLARHRGHSLHSDSSVQQLIDEEMRRRPPPPNYMNAIRYSRPFSSLSDLQRLIYPSLKKDRSQNNTNNINSNKNKPRRDQNRHSRRTNSTFFPPNIDNSIADLLNNDDECPKDVDTQLLVPDAFCVDNVQLMSDSELIDPGTIDNDDQQRLINS